MIFFKIEPHVSDIRLRIKGDNLEELFTSAYKGLYHLLLTPGCSDADHRIPKALTHAIHLSSQDTTTLLIDFLSEILSVSLVNKAIYCTMEIVNITPTHIDAQLTGHPIQKFSQNLKAVSHHEANVKLNSEGIYETVIVFDV